MADFGTAYINIAGNWAPLEAEINGLASGPIGKKMTTLGKSLTRNLTLPIVGVGAAAAKLSMDFQRSMTLIETQAGGAHKEVKKLGDQILNASAKGRFTQSANELAQGLFHIESTGARGKKAWADLKATADLATVGNANYEATTNAVVGVQKTQIKGTESLRKEIGLLNAGIGVGNLKMEDLNAAVGTGFVGSSKALGLSLQDDLAALGELTSQAVPANSAATRLRMTFSLLANPTTKAKDVLKEIGIGSEDLAKAMRRPDGVVNALKLLQDHMQGLSKIEQNQLLSAAFGGAKSGGTLLQLLENVGDLNKKYKELGENAGKFNKGLEETNKDPEVKLERAWRRIQATLIQLGSHILPIVVPMFQKVAGFIDKIGEKFAGLSSGSKKLVVEAGLFVAALGPGLTIAGKLVGTYSTLVSWINKATAATGLFATAEEGAGVAAAGSATVAGDSTYALARSFGRGRIASSIAQSGEFAMAGAAGARSIATSLAMKLGPAVAAIGLGNIVASAMHSDWRDAGFEAGGALAGGVAGFFLSGGNPLGAMLGVGLGSIGGELLSGLFASEKKLTPIQARIITQAQAATKAMHSQRQAAQGLAKATDNLAAATKRHEASTRRVTAAHKALNQTVRKFGPDSRQAREAELKLAEAQHQDSKAANEAKRAHQLSQRELRLFRLETVKSVASEKARLPSLDAQIKRLGKKSDEEKHNIPLLKRVTNMEEMAGKIRLNLARTFAQAQEVGGKKFARSLEQMTTEQAVFGKKFKGIGAAAKRVGRELEEFARLGITSTGRFAGAATTTQQIYTRDVESLSKATGISMRKIEKLLGAALEKMGVANVNFGSSGHQKKQAGGFIVPGTGSGDTFQTMLPPGSFILNREATRAFGFQNGGLMPVVLEPRERAFLPPEVKAMGGPRVLESLNQAVPRFQKGGSLGSEPQITGPSGALRSVGQAAIHEVYKGAQTYLAKHKPKMGGLAGLNVPTGPIEQMAREMVLRVWGKSQWAPFAAIEMREAGWNPHAQNPTSTAYGLAQNLHPETYPAAGRPGSNAPILEQAKAQLAWMVNYIKGRYGSPAGAWAHEQSAGWYKHGGLVGLARGGYNSDRKTAERFAGGGLVQLLPGVNMSVGKEPEIRGDLKALSDRVKKTIYVISGYRSPSHSVAVGGFANDPHTRGEAADIGVGSATRDSASILTESILHSVNLDRPFYPQSSAEINHVQLLKGSGGSSGSSSEKVPAVFHGAHTHSLSFGSVPKSLHGIEKEIKQRERELKVYRNAAAAAKGSPATQHAIQHNVAALEKRLRELTRARRKARFEAAKKRYSQKLAKIFGGLTGYERLIEGKQRLYEEASQTAEQIVSLEPQEPSGAGEGAEKSYAQAFASYVTGQEGPAYGRVLVTEADWRNTILTAEGRATEVELDLERHIREIEKKIEAAKKKGGPNSRERIAMLHFKEQELRKTLGEGRGLFYGGIKNAIQPPPLPLAGTGSFEDNLQEVQGIHWPDQHEQLPALALAFPGRRAGRFGGAIWDTQTSIEELGLKVAQAAGAGSAGGSEDSSARTQLLEELLKQANQRLLIRGIEQKTFAEKLQLGGSVQVMPPYAGKAHTGAIVPGPRTQEKTMIVKGREGIFTEEQMAAMGGDGGSIGDVKVHVHGDIVSSHPDPVEVLVNDRRFPAEVRKITDQDNRRAARGASRGFAAARRFG